MQKNTIGVCVIVVVATWLAVPSAAEAYIGPGAGISVIGTVVAFLAAILFGIIGFIWYPIKRMRAAIRARKSNQGGQRATSA